MRYQIICDSGCDFTATEHLGSAYVRLPMGLLLDGRLITDHAGLNLQTFLAARQQADRLSTVPPSQADWLTAFEQSEGEDLYAVTTSGELSASYLNAYRARKQFLDDRPGRNIYVFNTRSLCAGMLLAARGINALALSGCSFGQIVETVERDLLERSVYLVPGDGRALDRPLRPLPGFRPLLELVSPGVFRRRAMTTPKGQAAALAARVLEAAKALDTSRRVCVISHCAAPEAAARLRQRLESCRFREIVTVPASGVNALYGGAGSLAVAF